MAHFLTRHRLQKLIQPTSISCRTLCSTKFECTFTSRCFSTSTSKSTSTFTFPELGTYSPTEVANWAYARNPSQRHTHSHIGNSKNSHVDASVNETSPSAAPSFSMILPPPNVTGQLHLGHALMLAIQDSLMRWRNMCGDDVLWVPGVDHAGIATQSVVEKRLWREKELTRYDLGREGFVKEAHAWQDEYATRITEQMKSLCASLDWDKFVHTLDPKRSVAVTEAFVRLYEDGLVVRRPRLVNWCPHLRTGISDLEVDHKVLNGPTRIRIPGGEGGDGRQVQLGVIHTFAYPVVKVTSPAQQADTSLGETEYLTVSTTRLETMLGDEAVAVHPDDPRYTHLHNCHVRHPFNGRLLPIILDPELVDMELGTGAVKVTPAHDMNDYACGLRHDLPLVSIFDDSGKLNDKCGADAYVGMDRFEAREKICVDLESMGLFRGVEDHAMSLGVCSRSGDVIEPMLKSQWFVLCKDMGEKARLAVENGDITMQPPLQVAEWDRWLSNIQDWCVSRQLWWGHRIPAYRVVDKKEMNPSTNHISESTNVSIDIDEDDGVWVVGRNEDEAIQNAEILLGHSELEIMQDSDVLDTWFSSALLPLSALGWPLGSNDSADTPGSLLDPSLAHHYPLAMMETGADILFFWVARMVMLCTQLSSNKNTPPFKHVLLHPMVRDKSGRKMSKSLGNVIDPLHVINGVSLEDMLASLATSNLDPREVKNASTHMKRDFADGIPACGSDALRLALVSYMNQGKSVNMDIQRVVVWSHFGTKLWNAQNFIDRTIRNVVTSVDDGELGDVTSNAQRAELHSAFAKWMCGRGAAPTNVCVPPPEMASLDALTLSQRWILHRLSVMIEKHARAMERQELAEALDIVTQKFILQDLCDTFIESVKREPKDPRNAMTLVVCMDAVLRTLHPFAPNITQRLWDHSIEVAQSLNTKNEECDKANQKPVISLTSAIAPSDEFRTHENDTQAQVDMSIVLETAAALRGLAVEAASVTVKGRTRAIVTIKNSSENSDMLEALTREMDVVRHLCRLHDVQVVSCDDHNISKDYDKAISRVVRGEQVVVHILIEVKDQEARSRVAKELQNLEARQIKVERERLKMSKRVGNLKYRANAPEAVLAKDDLALADWEAKLRTVETTIDALKGALDEN